MQYNATFHGSMKGIFHLKISDISLIFAPNIYCGCSLEPPHWGGSNEYPQSMFLSLNKKKNNVYPGKPQFPYINFVFSIVFITRTCSRNVFDSPKSGLNIWILVCNLTEAVWIYTWNRRYQAFSRFY